MNVAFAVLADYANVSRDGKLNVMGIFDRVFARKLPTRFPPIQLVIRIEAEPDELGQEHGIGVQLADPDDQIVFDINGKFVPQAPVPGERVTINHVIRLADIPVQRTGPHRIRISLDGTPASEIVLRVSEAPSQPPGAPGNGDTVFH